MIRTIELPVRFAHVDAAGIVFYPRYFEMLNASLEALFEDRLGVGFAALHLDRRLGVPTVSLEASFKAPSRLGERLCFDMGVEAVGRSSATLTHRVTCGGEVRFEARSVIVCMDLDAGRSVPWPEDLAAPLHAAAGGS